MSYRVSSANSPSHERDILAFIRPKRELHQNPKCIEMKSLNRHITSARSEEQQEKASQGFPHKLRSLNDMDCLIEMLMGGVHA